MIDNCFYYFQFVMDYKVTFLPFNKSITVPAGTLISEAAALGGIIALHIPCGGRGICGKCTVRISESTDTATSGTASGRSVFACTTGVQGTMSVWIEQKPYGARSCIVSAAAFEELLLEHAGLTPLCRKILVQTKPAGIEDNFSDFELLETAINGQPEHGGLRCSRTVLQSMAQALRKQNGKVTATLFSENAVQELIMLEDGDTLAAHYGIGCDIGTTTISVRLIDCASGKILATESDYNGQISRGADVISRIEYGRSAQRREELRRLALETINQLIGTACQRSSISSTMITAMLIAGNSTMVHLFLGIDAKYLREHPYVPTVKSVPPLTAADCGLSINPEAKVLFSPGVGSYVGGDITAGLLCTDMIRSSEGISLFIDIGTNGEIVIGNSEFLMTTACSAGPAFEGSGITCGMRAAPGAIDSFEIERNGESIDWTVIGDSKPAGICGSGFISLLGELLKAGTIDRSGKFTDTVPAERRVKTRGTTGLILVSGAHTTHGRDIVITEPDIDNLIRTKAAIFSACDLMLSSAGLDFSKVNKVLIAGGFGRFIDIDDAVRIGLFPNIATSKFTYLGNTSLAGASLALLSKKYRDELRTLPGRMTYVELSNDQRYMDAYVAALFLPHTDLTRFQCR
jgi:uncharacterized 2Fe-2S/4Fe-4S cluster protein (DUF4445 family)